MHWDLAAWHREVKRRHDSDPKTTAQADDRQIGVDYIADWIAVNV